MASALSGRRRSAACTSLSAPATSLALFTKPVAQVPGRRCGWPPSNSVAAQVSRVMMCLVSAACPAHHGSAGFWASWPSINSFSIFLNAAAEIAADRFMKEKGYPCRFLFSASYIKYPEIRIGIPRNKQIHFTGLNYLGDVLFILET